MVLLPPDWLTHRGGTLRLCPDGQSWAVLLDNQPQYLVRPIPAEGKFASFVEQTISGSRLYGKTVYSSTDEALRGGLEDLRKLLGW